MVAVTVGHSVHGQCTYVRWGVCHCFVILYLRLNRDELRGDWGRSRNEQLRDLYSSSDIVGVIRWRRVRWAGEVARMGDRWGKLCESDYLEDLEINGEGNIKMDLQETRWGRGLIWLRRGRSGRFLWKRLWTWMFYKTQGISWSTEENITFSRTFVEWS
jgi:hypothetical protein